MENDEMADDPKDRGKNAHAPHAEPPRPERHPASDPKSDASGGKKDPAKDRLAKDGEARKKQAEAAHARDGWKPTPTQEENDLAALGVPAIEIQKRDDGSGPDPFATTRDMTPDRTHPGYETR
jgi:hypothetical protein